MMSKRTTASLLLVSLLAVPQVFADSNSAQLSVSVQVIGRTILTVDSQPQSIDITAADVARGYVEVPEAVVFRVRSNAANGYRMEFEPVSYPFGRAEINLDNATATVGADGTWLTRPYQQGMTTGSLNVRLMLSPDAAPGNYAWPVRLAANSL